MKFFFVNGTENLYLNVRLGFRFSRYKLSLDAQPQALQKADQAEFPPNYARHDSELIYTPSTDPGLR